MLRTLYIFHKKNQDNMLQQQQATLPQLQPGSFSFTDLLYMCEQFLRDRA